MQEKFATEDRDSPYKGGWFRLRIKLSSAYPAALPAKDAVVFETRTWHPAVADDDANRGHVCLGDFFEWTPESKLFDLLNAIRGVLAAPSDSVYQGIRANKGSDRGERENELPLLFLVCYAGFGANPEAQAQLSRDEMAEFEAKARDYVTRYCIDAGGGDDDEDDDEDDD